jgi:hypothetical protein
MKLEIRFKTKEEASAAKQYLAEDVRIIQANIRKSLPDFKGHVNHLWSLWIHPFSEADYIMICRTARTGTLGNVLN